MFDLDQDNLSEKLSGLSLVQYGATWCGNCRMIKPKVKRLAEAHSEVNFIYVDAEKYPNSRKLADVSNLPTFAVFKDSELISQTQGNKIEAVESLLEELKK